MNAFRFRCSECNIVFDLVAAPPADWGGPMEPDTECGAPTCTSCPWCGSAVKLVHDVATIAEPEAAS